MLHRSVSIIMLRIDYRMPLGLMIQPAAQIVRELPPRPKSYCVTLFFHAGRYLPLGNVWSTVVAGGETRTASHKAVFSKHLETSTVALTHCTVLVPKKKPLTTAPSWFP